MDRPDPLATNHPDDPLQRHIAYEKLITAISTRFIDISAGDIDAEIYSALETLGRYAGHDRSYVVLFSQDGSLFETVFEWCAEGIPSQRHRIVGRLTRSMPWFAQKIAAGEVIRLNCVDQLSGQSQADFEECREEGIRSILMAPMFLRGEAVGLLGFDAIRAERLWGDDETALLQIVGEIIVSALERKRAEEALLQANQMLEIRVAERTREIERRSRAGEALRDILKVLNSNRELPDVLDYIVTQACQLLGATATLIRQADLQQQTATTEASYNLPDEFASIRSTRLYYNANDLILMSRRPVVISDIPATYRPMLEMRDGLDDFQRAYIAALLNHYHSMLSVPLFIREEIYGSINFFFSRLHEFSEDDIQLAMSLADQAALAIENARLYREEHLRREESERRRRVAESLRDIMSVLNSNITLDEILAKIVSQAVDLLNCEAVAIYRLLEREGWLETQATFGLESAFTQNLRIPVGHGIAGRVVLNRAPLAVSDALNTAGLLDDPGLPEDLRRVLQALVVRYQSFLSVPLISKGEIYGAITLYYRQPRPFTGEEIALAVAFAGQAALAIENSRLRSQREQDAIATERNRLARDLHDAVTQTLFSASLIAEVLPRIWERSPEEGRHRLEELRQLSRGALAEMRTLLLELRPSTLTEAHFSDLLRQLAEAISGRARLPIHLQVEGDLLLDPDVQVGLYRISQEALNNVVKHSHATQVEIRLSMSTSSRPFQPPVQVVDLIIRDDGHGFDPAAVSPNHFGLGIMQERAQTIGAQLVVHSSPGQGSQVTVHWEG